MGSIKDIVEAVEARLVANSFVATEEVFDFDSDGNVDHLDYEAFSLNFSGP